MASTNMLPNLSMSKKGDGEGGGDGQNRPERIRYAHCQPAIPPSRQRQQHQQLCLAVCDVGTLQGGWAPFSSRPTPRAKGPPLS
jgi:hypothetical protein